MTLQQKYRTEYVISDLLTTSLAVYLFNIIRFHLIEHAHISYGSVGAFIASTTVISGQIIIPLVMMLVYYLSGFYNDVFSKSRVNVFNTTLLSAFIGTTIILLLMLINDLTIDRTRDYSVVASLFVLLFGLVFIPRIIITRHIFKKIRRGDIYFPSIIVGHEALTDSFYASIPDFTASGMRPVALCDVNFESAASNTTSHGLDIIAPNDIEQYCDTHSIAPPYESP